VAQTENSSSSRYSDPFIERVGDYIDGSETEERVCVCVCVCVCVMVCSCVFCHKF